VANSIDAFEKAAIAEKTAAGPPRFDLDRCVHCGLCLNSCPTYRILGLEMDSPRGRVYQMVQVANGAPMSESYSEHIGLCLACRGCESACPSGVPYGSMVEDARAELETHARRGPLTRWMRRALFGTLLESRVAMTAAGAALYLYEASGARGLIHSLGLARLVGLHDLHQLTPSADPPFFFSHIGQTYPAEGQRRYRVAFLAGCLANVFFARLNEASVRVLQKNGCEVVLPVGQGCCGALPLHAGLREIARADARRNIDALREGAFDAIVTNAAGCGSTLKEYGALLAEDAEYSSAAAAFAAQVRDITEFLAGIDLRPAENPVHATVTYQDSCHLAHGQRIRSAPRKLLAAIPGLTLQEMPGSDLCCGSAGVYNIVQNEMAVRILAAKMDAVQTTGADIIATANPGCMLQLQAGVRSRKGKQEVVHVIELLDRAYRGTGSPEKA
jgi:glycolate oxidase iron-sulfur subunit